MSPSDSKTLNQPPRFFWTRYRQWARAATPLWLWHIVFLVALTVATWPILVDAVYLALVLFPALLIAGFGDLRALARSWTVRATLAFLVFMVLTPLWTGGIGEAGWPELALATLGVATFTVITAHLMAAEAGAADRLFKALGVVMLVTALYSAVNEYGSHWFTERLTILPWTAPDTGAAVLGLILTGIATGPGMNAEEWPGMRLIYWAIAILLAVLLLMTQTPTVLIAVVAAIAVAVVVRPPKLGRAAMWIAGAVIVLGLVLVLLAPGLYGDWAASIAAFWHLAQDHMLLGFGAQRQGQVLVFSGGQYLAAPHNMIVTALVFGGAIAAVLLVALFVATIVGGVRGSRRGPSPAPLALAVYVTVYGLMAALIVSAPGWQWLVLWLPVGIVAGAELRARTAA